MRALWVMIASAGCSAVAAAGPVFFDDFDGDALLPHWVQPPATNWDYQVANGRLTVSRLRYPSSPKSTGNYTGIGAGFAQQNGDFRMDAWVGWEVGQSPHRLDVSVLTASPPSGFLATFSYNSGSLVFGVNGGAARTIPAPVAGIHQITIGREGSSFYFGLDGVHVGTFADPFQAPAGGIYFFFVGPYPGTLAPLTVDRVQVVPVPNALLFAGASGCLLTFRRRCITSAS